VARNGPELKTESTSLAAVDVASRTLEIELAAIREDTGEEISAASERPMPVQRGAASIESSRTQPTSEAVGARHEPKSMCDAAKDEAAAEGEARTGT
jgi:hypothetical protein